MDPLISNGRGRRILQRIYVPLRNAWILAALCTSRVLPMELRILYRAELTEGLQKPERC